MRQERLYIASCEAESLERIFAFDPGFFVMGGSRWGVTALDEIRRLCPDAVVLDCALLGMDGLEALNGFRHMLAPPRVLFLQRMGHLEPAKDVDRTLRAPWTAETLLTAAREAAERPLPGLAAGWEAQRQAAAGELLDQLNVSPRLKGRAYMQCAAAALACAPQLAASYSERLYPFVAARYQTTPRAVERAIRTAVEDTWLHGRLSAIQALFGLSVDAEKGKPTNAECLSLLAEHVRLRLLPSSE